MSLLRTHRDQKIGQAVDAGSRKCAFRIHDMVAEGAVGRLFNEDGGKTPKGIDQRTYLDLIGRATVQRLTESAAASLGSHVTYTVVSIASEEAPDTANFWGVAFDYDGSPQKLGKFTAACAFQANHCADYSPGPHVRPDLPPAA